MKYAVTVSVDTDSLSGFTDSYIASLWHVGQANPAPHDDPDAGAFAEKIGREIIARFLRNMPAELYAHQGHHHYFSNLIKHGKMVDGEWVPNAAEQAGAE
ncbi:hypothetical protein [Glaciimonas sp. PCH181]|uniref:hypothetical protein n=1 Tax=Glaciimonas sp. PCH181 TaxID=2133943 RepID=UPI000D3AD07C|nr:hypothetical protein [Glaciimonas sp. PCH181]PUA17304.1 hypothetical protein C7W93_15365 [Glaciimonas sp. PCH181]